MGFAHRDRRAHSAIAASVLSTSTPDRRRPAPPARPLRPIQIFREASHVKASVTISPWNFSSPEEGPTIGEREAGSVALGVISAGS
jgi:hypothetical protein